MNVPSATQPTGSSEKQRKLQNFDIICISVMDWDWPFPTSRHNLMRQFARDNRVLFVDPPINYSTEYRNLPNKPEMRAKFWRSLRGQIIERESNLYSFTPPPVAPFNRLPPTLLEPVLKSNGWIFKGAVKKAARRLAMSRPLLWISLNPYFGIAAKDQLDELLTVYHCTDDVAYFPGYSPKIVEVENRLIERSDLVITTSQMLQANKGVHNPDTVFIPNGANVGLFRQAIDSSRPLPADLSAIPEPRIGFTGQIEFRFDIELIQAVAQQRRDLSFVLIGNKKRETVGLEKLEAEPNIYFLGNRPQEELPDYLRGLQVVMIPYKSNALTRSIYPLKLHEYFAAGRPVVATPLPSLEEFREHISLASNPAEFIAAIDSALAEGTDPVLVKQRQAIAENYSWKLIADRIGELILSRLDRTL
jgi:glycosyltransferase involved in cell wall biosynthesis